MIKPKKRRFDRALARALVIACAGLVGTANMAAAQTAPPAPKVFVAPEVPANWHAARVNGIDLLLPPDLIVMQDFSTEHVWGQADEVGKSGFGLRIAFSDTPEREVLRDKAVPTGALVFASGHIFQTYSAVAPKDAESPGSMDLLVSDLPLLGDARLIVALATMNRDIGQYRPMFAQFLAGLTLPHPGKQLQRDLLGGVVRLPIGPGWNGARQNDTNDVYLFTDDLKGRIQLDRGEVKTGGMPQDTVGTPVVFLGQNAQFFAYEDGSETVEDATGDTGQARVIVLETCLPDGAAITLRFSGMPGLFHAASVADMVAGGNIVMPEGSGPCPRETLPTGSQLTLSGARADIAPPFDVAPAGQTQPRANGEALGGLYSYTLPIGWLATPEAGDKRIHFAKADGSAAIVLARGAALLAPDGPAALVPIGTYHGPDITFGWPSERFEWDGPGNPEGFQRLFVHSHCLPGDERFGMLVSGSKAFQDEGDLSKALRGIKLNMPDEIKACSDPAEGIGQAILDLPAQDEAPPVAPPVPTDPSPASLGQTEWFAQVPLAALPSPATESLAGQWQGVAMFAAPSEAPAVPPAQGRQVATDAKAAAIAALPTPPLPPPSLSLARETVVDADRFTAVEGGYSLYQNDRYGTFISYPANFFLPEPPPGNGDGRQFVSVDGTSQFYVFAQFNALGQSQNEQIAQDKSDPAHADTSYERVGPGWYVLSGTTGDKIFYRRVIEDMDGLIRVFEITYPTARKAEFDAVVTYMANSFGPGSDRVVNQPAVVAQPPSQTPTQTAQPSANGLPKVKVNALHVPARGSAERGAIIDAARPGAEKPIGRRVIFVVSQIRTDGTWAYFQGRPVNPDGTALLWATTPFANEIRKGVMSDVYMALLLKQGGTWRVVETALGPTDVAWYDWLAPYDLPESLFSGQ